MRPSKEPESESPHISDAYFLGLEMELATLNLKLEIKSHVQGIAGRDLK